MQLMTRPKKQLPPLSSEAWVTRDEAKDLFGVTKNTIKRWEVEDELTTTTRPSRGGEATMILREELVEAAARRGHKPVSPGAGMSAEAMQSKILELEQRNLVLKALLRQCEERLDRYMERALDPAMRRGKQDLPDPDEEDDY